MKIQTLEVPFDSGRYCERMGLGPSSLLKSGLVNRLRFLGHEVAVERIQLAAGEFPTEIKSTFSLADRISRRVAQARAQGSFPVVLSGNCNASLGTISGLGAAKTGVLWFDAHGEFNTPETTTSGFLDGMGLAIATGVCWHRLAESIHNWSRLSPRHAILVGVRQTDTDEQEALSASGLQQIPAAEAKQHGIRPLLGPALQALIRRVDQFYVHFDLDVLDPAEAQWNPWVPEGGLTIEQAEESLELLAGGPPIAAVGFASHDPSLDPVRSSEAARRLLDRALALAGA
jgi:arginase